MNTFTQAEQVFECVGKAHISTTSAFCPENPASHKFITNITKLYFRQLQEQHSKSSELTTARVLQELSKVAAELTSQTLRTSSAHMVETEEVVKVLCQFVNQFQQKVAGLGNAVKDVAEKIVTMNNVKVFNFLMFIPAYRTFPLFCFLLSTSGCWYKFITESRIR